MAKITLATFKSFIKKNEGKLYIDNRTTFDGMVDGIVSCDDDGFRKAVSDEGRFGKNSLGISGVYLVGSSRDYFTPYEDDNFVGYHVYNCCGSFNLCVKKEK